MLLLFTLLGKNCPTHPDQQNEILIILEYVRGDKVMNLMTPQPAILKFFSQLFPVGEKIHGEVLPETWSVTILKKCGFLVLYP